MTKEADTDMSIVLPATMPGPGKLLAAAFVVAVWTLALLLEVGVFQDTPIRIDGRGLRIEGETPIVDPYASGTRPQTNEDRASSHEGRRRDR